MKDAIKRTIILLIILVMWTGFSIYDFNRNAHIVVIVVDVIVIVFIVILCFLSPFLPSEVKSVQQIEDEIVQIEMKQKLA